jgi:hypothetical protein
MAQALAVERAKPVGVNAGQDVYIGGAEADARGLPGRLSGRDTETTARGAAFNALDPRMQDFAVGPTETEFRGTTLAEEFSNLGDMGPEQQNYFGLQEERTPRNYSAPDGSVGVTLDGTRDAATGAPIPAGAQVSTSQLQTDNPNNLRPNVVGNLQESQIALADFQTTMGHLREIAQDPSLFGMVGNVRRFGQGLIQQGSAGAALLGADRFSEVAADLQRAGVAPEFFDPNLNDIDKVATLAAYQAAGALAAQTGRGLSDNDFRKFRTILGDPTAWLSDRQSFLAGLDRVESLAMDMSANRAKALGQGAPDATPQDSGVADAMTPPEDTGRPVYNINGDRIR